MLACEFASKSGFNTTRPLSLSFACILAAIGKFRITPVSFIKDTESYEVCRFLAVFLESDSVLLPWAVLVLCNLSDIQD